MDVRQMVEVEAKMGKRSEFQPRVRARFGCCVIYAEAPPFNSLFPVQVVLKNTAKLQTAHHVVVTDNLQWSRWNIKKTKDG